MQQIATELSEIGLSTNESKVYLALLELNKASTSQISLKTDIQRVNIYDVLKKLQQKGLTNIIIENDTKYYRPSDPEQIKKIIEEKKLKLKDVEKSIPRLEELYHATTAEIVVKQHIGKKGVIAAYNSLMEKAIESKEITSIGSTGLMREKLPIFTQQFLKKIRENNVVPRILFFESARKIKPFKGTTAKYLPKELKFIPLTTYITKNFVCIISLEAMFAIEIESEMLYKNYKEYANWLWKISSE